MIAVRMVVTIVRGRSNDAVDLLKKFNANSDVTVRIYKNRIGDSQEAVVEWEFEDLAHYDRFYKEMAANPENSELWKPWHEATTGAKTNVWELVELE